MYQWDGDTAYIHPPSKSWQKKGLYTFAPQPIVPRKGVDRKVTWLEQRWRRCCQAARDPPQRSSSLTLPSKTGKHWKTLGNIGKTENREFWSNDCHGRCLSFAPLRYGINSAEMWIMQPQTLKSHLWDRYVAPDFKVHFCRTATYQTLRATHPTGATLQCIAAG